MLDKHTFGKTPAAIYLADRLNVLNDERYTQKLSSKIHAMQACINDVVRAHENDYLDLKTLAFFVKSMRRTVEDTAQNFLEYDQYVNKAGHPMPDKLSIDLMMNIIKGELKSISRRAREVRLLKDKQNRVLHALKREVNVSFDDQSEFTTKVEKDAIVLAEVIFETPNITIKDVKDETTPETLMARSRAKCERLGKSTTFYDEE